jgi:hypothetical protein
LVLLPAVVGLFALTQAVGDAALKMDGHIVSEVTGSVEMPAALPAFTCLQLQVIDEVELISDMLADGGCD